MTVTTITPEDGSHRIHTYFKGSPYSHDSRTVLYTRFRSLGDRASVCVFDTVSGTEQTIGDSSCVTYHNGAWAYFCDDGRKIIYQKAYGFGASVEQPSVVACYDIEKRTTVEFDGHVGLYYGDIGTRYLEIDTDRPADEQGSMGIYLRRLDGTDRYCLATVDQMLAIHPNGASIRGSGVLLRLGGEMSPDRSKVMLYVVTRNGTLIRDYFVCGPDGSGLEYHGRIGGHLMWHPNSRDVVGFINPNHSSYFGQLRGTSSAWGYGLLGCYDTSVKCMRVLSDYRLPGFPHFAPSPDGKKIAIDVNGEKELNLFVYDYDTNDLTKLHTEPRDLDVRDRRDEALRTRPEFSDHFAQMRKSTTPKIHAHPVFSRDSGRIIYNSCVDGTVRLREIDV